MIDQKACEKIMSTKGLKERKVGKKNHGSEANAKKKRIKVTKEHEKKWKGERERKMTIRERIRRGSEAIR